MHECMIYRFECMANDGWVMLVMNEKGRATHFNKPNLSTSQARSSLMHSLPPSPPPHNCNSLAGLQQQQLAVVLEGRLLSPEGMGAEHRGEAGARWLQVGGGSALEGRPELIGSPSQPGRGQVACSPHAHGYAGRGICRRQARLRSPRTTQVPMTIKTQTITWT